MLTGLCALIAVAIAGEDPAAAAASDWGLHLAGGPGVGIPAPGLQGHGVGRAELRLGKVGLSLAGREGVASNQLRTIGAIFIGGRLDVAEQGWLRGGFAHSHETLWGLFTQAPVASFAGVADGIVHRGGVEIGGGYRASLLPDMAGGRLGVGLDAWVTWLPDAGGPNWTVGVDQLFFIRVQ